MGAIIVGSEALLLVDFAAYRALNTVPNDLETNKLWNWALNKWHFITDCKFLCNLCQLFQVQSSGVVFMKLMHMAGKSGKSQGTRASHTDKKLERRLNVYPKWQKLIMGNEFVPLQSEIRALSLNNHMFCLILQLL